MREAGMALEDNTDRSAAARLRVLRNTWDGRADTGVFARYTPIHRRTHIIPSLEVWFAFEGCCVSTARSYYDEHRFGRLLDWLEGRALMSRNSRPVLALVSEELAEDIRRAASASPAEHFTTFRHDFRDLEAEVLKGSTHDQL